jgi:hypothetical protein
MRWKYYKPPETGDIRFQEKFLLLPKSINNETRWLEKAKYSQVYKKCYFYYNGELMSSYNWKDDEWIS